MASMIKLRTFIKAICLGTASLWPFSKIFQSKAASYAKEGITRVELKVIKMRVMGEREILTGRQAFDEITRYLKWQRKHLNHPKAQGGMETALKDLEALSEPHDRKSPYINEFGNKVPGASKNHTIY